MSNNGPKSEFNGADETANNKPKASDEELPQTGEKDNKLGILGLFSVSLASLFGLGEKKKEGRLEVLSIVTNKRLSES